MSKIVLLILLSISFCSCQDNKFVKFGAFTNWAEVNRTPASASDGSSIQLKFIKFQDPKQIALYCLRDSAKPKNCYSDHFNKSVKSFEAVEGSLDHASIKALNETFKFEKVQENLSQIFNDYKKPLNPEIKSIVQKRKDFCEQNAHKFPKKCMTHFLEKDTFKVLNKIYSKKKMNGEEYLYIKNKLRHHLQEELTKKKF